MGGILALIVDMEWVARCIDGCFLLALVGMGIAVCMGS